jgi:hypothetical protein
VLLIGNLFAHNYERSPLFKGGVRGAIINNLIYDPGQRAVHYNLIAEMGCPSLPGRQDDGRRQRPARRHVDAAGPRLPRRSAATETLSIMAATTSRSTIGRPLPLLGSYTTTGAKIIETDKPPVWPTAVTPVPARDVQKLVLAGVGARPWDRDYHDARLVADVGRGARLRSSTAKPMSTVMCRFARPTVRSIPPTGTWRRWSRRPAQRSIMPAKSQTLMLPEGGGG